MTTHLDPSVGRQDKESQTKSVVDRETDSKKAKAKLLQFMKASKIVIEDPQTPKMKAFLKSLSESATDKIE